MCQLYTVIYTLNFSRYELATHSAYTTFRRFILKTMSIMVVIYLIYTFYKTIGYKLIKFRTTVVHNNAVGFVALVH